jgi:hypothetical protein
MRQLAEPAYQSAWCARPTDWETYFRRPYKEFWQWLQDCAAENLQLALLELVRLSARETVAVDLYNMPPGLAMQLTQPDHIVFLVAQPRRVVREYYDRPGHREIYDCIMALRDPEAALANTNQMLEYGARLYWDELLQTGLPYILRGDDSTVERTLALVEQQFGWGEDT